MPVADITVTVDGKRVSVPVGSTVLEAAQAAGIDIPTLCHHPDQQVKAVCRICVVEIEGIRSLAAACAFPASDGMMVRTNTPRVRTARRTILELMLAHHPQDCLQCHRNLDCELQDLAHRLGVREIDFPPVLRVFQR